MATRIRLSRARGWRMPPNTLKVDRSTPWGNPFVVGRHGDREECVHLYRLLLGGRLLFGGGICMSHDNVSEQHATLDYVAAHLHELRGRNLACWCPLDAPCHADVLLELANQGDD